MNIRLQLPKLTDLRPRITVIGVGGAGGNAINNMIASGLQGVDFVVANTDAQALSATSAEHRIQLGVNLTEGLGAGAKPEIGEAAAEEALDDIRAQISGSHMVFIAAGMGGGTGTGAAGVIARIAKEAGILTVGVVTKPFQFEGTRRMRIAEAGIAELKKHVDTLIVIPNQNLFRISNEKTTFAEAFILADQVLYSGIACIVDLIVKEGLINLDFADVRTVMMGMGTAMMGTGEASGERRAMIAAEEAISNPLLDDISLRGARGLLLSIIGGKSLTLYEVDEAASRVRQEVDPEANIIVGATFDESLDDRIRVSIVASGMSRLDEPQQSPVAVREAPARPQPMQATVPHQEPSAPQPHQSFPRPAAQVDWPPAAAAVPPLPDAGRQAPAPSASQTANAHPVAQPTASAHPAWHAAPSGPTTAVAPPPAANAPAAQPPRETWRGPGGVTIEEGLPPIAAPPLPLQPTAPQPQPAPAADAARAPATAFTPAPPAEIKRAPQRRMPEVGDFPPVAQREYIAKTAAGAEGLPQPPLPAVAPRIYSGPPESVPRKKGLFERITGLSRRDAAADQRTSYSAPSNAHRPMQPHQPGGQQASHGDAGRGSRTTEQDVELPVFFDRERK